ncbi:NAD(P)-binding protein [Aureobasidium sp. EXF-8845]|nr:NAD(P)-binding protein [Aureobasidium sp. EXF-8845]KAI4854739.1 NAD(P)-binding protein [Aureobasidium sp. EXF-8846]
MSTSQALQYLGTATALLLTYKVISFTSIYFKPSKLHLYNQSGDSWALITGSTNGIGEGFAHALCAKNFNVVLHGRNQQKLDTLRSTLQKQHPNVKIETVIADVFDIDVDIESIVNTCINLPGKLTLLVNNVGGAPLSPSYATLAEVDAAYVDKIINLNSRFPTQLTRALLPLLNKNPKSLVLSTCSITGFRGLPYLSIYSSTKAFNFTLNQSLASELNAENSGTSMLGIIIANVVSGGNKTTEGAFTCTGLQMAEFSLQRVGCGQTAVFGWWRHAVQWWAMSLLPEWVTEKVLIGVMKERRVEEQKGK